MILEVRAVAPFYKNGFVVGCSRTREAVLVDPGDEVDELLGAARDLDVDVQAILLTHAHVDHVTGVAATKEALDVPVYLHRDDVFFSTSRPSSTGGCWVEGEAAAADRRLLRRFDGRFRRL